MQTPSSENMPPRLLSGPSRFSVLQIDFQRLKRGVQKRVDNIEKKSQMRTLRNLAEDGNQPAIEALLKRVPVSRRAEILNKPSEKKGRFPLEEAAKNGNKKVVSTLLDYGADPNLINPKTGVTALHTAVQIAIRTKKYAEYPPVAELADYPLTRDVPTSSDVLTLDLTEEARRNVDNNNQGVAAEVGKLHEKILQVQHRPITKAGKELTEIPQFPHLEATIASLQKKMTDGSLTCEELTLAYLDRIHAVDQTGPRLNALMELNPEAREIAKKLDAERKAGHLRGPCHGIPILLKDVIGTADQMSHSGGSLALAGSKAPEDAQLVTRLREAGFVILGKTNTTEWLNFRTERWPSGYSERGGQTKNPYAQDRSPGGSSSGSAVAVSANLTVVAIGSDCGGSITSPSAYNGITGFRPTVGMVGRSGALLATDTMDVLGPMGRSVQDVATLLSVIAGTDDLDGATQNPKRPEAGTDFTRFFSEPDGLKGKTLGVIHDNSLEQPPVRAVFENALQALRALGATVVEVKIPKVDHWIPYGPALDRVRRYEMNRNFTAFLKEQTSGSVNSLETLDKFNKKHGTYAKFGDEKLASLQQDLPTDAQYSQDLKDLEYYAGTMGIGQELNHDRTAFLTSKKTVPVDALIGLTTAPAFLIDPVLGDRWDGGFGYNPAVIGHPQLTVPIGLVNNALPLGLSIVGEKWADEKVLGIGYRLQEALKPRTPPTFPDSISN